MLRQFTRHIQRICFCSSSFGANVLSSQISRAHAGIWPSYCDAFYQPGSRRGFGTCLAEGGLLGKETHLISRSDGIHSGSLHEGVNMDKLFE